MFRFIIQNTTHWFWALVAAVLLPGDLRAEPILLEWFGSDPVAAGRATIEGDADRFDFSSGEVTAHYDTGKPTAKMIWPLAKSLDETTDFRVEVDFTIRSNGFSARSDEFAQIAFGLINSVTTGANRVGGGSTPGDGFDIVTIDYFPNISDNPIFRSPTLAPTIIESDRGAAYYSHLRFPQGGESALDDPGEADLPRDVPLTAILAYGSNDSGQRILTVQLEDSGGPRLINGGTFFPGGLDGDTATIQLCVSCITGDVEFSVDRFALTLWEDTYLDADEPSSVIADLVFDAIRVFDTVTPDPPLGDADGNLVVDAADLAILLSHWGTGTTFEQGNFDGLGVVARSDLKILFSNWTIHAGAVSDASEQAVPEPSTALLLVAGIAVLLTTLRRRPSRSGERSVLAA